MLLSPARNGLTLSLSRPPSPLFVEDLLENHRIWQRKSDLLVKRCAGPLMVNRPEDVGSRRQFGGARRDRTDDLNTASVARCLVLEGFYKIWFHPTVPKSQWLKELDH